MDSKFLFRTYTHAHHFTTMARPYVLGESLKNVGGPVPVEGDWILNRGYGYSWIVPKEEFERRGYKQKPPDRDARVIFALDAIQEEAEAVPLVEAAYLRSDGLEFAMVCTELPPSELRSETERRVEAKIDPSGATRIGSIWCVDQPPVVGWIVAYHRIQP
jgi:hypothetical protein